MITFEQILEDVGYINLVPPENRITCSEEDYKTYYIQRNKLYNKAFHRFKNSFFKEYKLEFNEDILYEIWEQFLYSNEITTKELNKIINFTRKIVHIMESP